jgi:IS30 family transposase
VLYVPEEVWKEVLKERSISRRGPHADEKEYARLSSLLVPLIKDKHQSLPQIFQTHKEEIRWSYVTILKWISSSLIPGIKNIDLTKRVRYPAHYKKSKFEPTNYAVLTNRTYDDFIAFISENPFTEVVEMDTVLSCVGVNACLLTLLFRKSNFMLAFLLRNKTTAEVAKLFYWIRKEIGIELYRKAFACILTDNGNEFADPKVTEIDEETGERVSRVFYCDPGKSGQKGKIEKNHVELRKIFPKGCNFSLFNQEQINIALSHVNSEPRAILNRNAPGTIAKVFLNEKILGLNEYQFVDPDSVQLHPSLLRK